MPEGDEKGRTLLSTVFLKKKLTIDIWKTTFYSKAMQSANYFIHHGKSTNAAYLQKFSQFSFCFYY